MPGKKAKTKEKKLDPKKIKKVHYLNLIPKKSNEYKIYKNQYSSGGGMISFDIKGGEKEAFKFLDNLKLVKLAVSLGGTESLACHPYSMTHADVSKETKKLFDEWAVTGRAEEMEKGHGVTVN